MANTLCPDTTNQINITIDATNDDATCIDAMNADVTCNYIPYVVMLLILVLLLLIDLGYVFKSQKLAGHSYVVKMVLSAGLDYVFKTLHLPFKIIYSTSII